MVWAPPLPLLGLEESEVLFDVLQTFVHGREDDTDNGFLREPGDPVPDGLMLLDVVLGFLAQGLDGGMRESGEFQLVHSSEDTRLDDGILGSG